MMGQKERTERWKKKDPVGFYRSTRKRTRKYYATEEGRANNRIAVKRYQAKHRDALLDKARNRRAALRQIVVAAKTAPCMDCRGVFPSECMDFDHRPGEPKLREVSAMVRRGCRPDGLLREIAKCDLVCANCHRIRTHRRHRAGETNVPTIVDATTGSQFKLYAPPVPMEES